MRRLLGLTLIVLAACSPARPGEQLILGDVLQRADFDTPDTNWDAGAQGNVQIGIADGAYRMQTDANDYVRGFNNAQYADVVIDVSGLQLSPDDNSAYGVVCRAATGNSGNGYYFLVGGDGSYSIREGAQGEVRPLVHWARTDAVNTGAALNSIRAVCVADYLALYVNGEFLAEFRDTTYSSGYVGFAAAASEGATVEVAFDDLIVREGSLVR